MLSIQNTNSLAGNDPTNPHVPNWQRSIRKSQTGSIQEVQYSQEANIKHQIHWLQKNFQSH